MARDYAVDDATVKTAARRHNAMIAGFALSIATLIVCTSAAASTLSPFGLFIVSGLIPSVALFFAIHAFSNHWQIEKERRRESLRRNGAPVLGLPPNRMSFDAALKQAEKQGKPMVGGYLVGFELDTGEPIWITDDEICGHGAVFAKTGVGKTLWLEGLMFQQMCRGRASGLTFIDAKRDPGTLADIILMALITGRIEDLLVVDPFEPVCAYNFAFTTQRPDVKARKVLRCGLPPTPDQSTTKHYDRLAADAVYRLVRAMESLGLAWSVRDVAVALSAFTVAYPRLRDLLNEQGAKQAMVELGHLASSYRTAKGSLDSARLTDNLRGIASELHSIANSEAGEMFCVPRADLSLTDAILRGKIIYYMLPRLEEAESAARMVKVFREDLEVSIGEVTSSRHHRLEDPHLVIIDEGASTFGPTWANLFELARKGRFALLFGAQSIGGLMDSTLGLSEQFYERVIANVNLKVIMRLGDNRTAEDMCEWIGKVNTTKKTIATGMSSSLNSRELTRHLEINKRLADGIRDGFTFAEDEKDLVSAEELKHEMSAEKGLAWFDKGDGKLRKGRCIWFDSELPAMWEGREFLVRYESVEADEIGLAEWVDEHILATERSETRRKHDGQAAASEDDDSAASKDENKNGGSTGEEPSDGGPFRLNLLKGFRGMGRARTLVAEAPPAPKEPEKAAAAQETSPAQSSEAPDKKPEPAISQSGGNKNDLEPSPAGPISSQETPRTNGANEPNSPPKQGKSSLSFKNETANNATNHHGITENKTGAIGSPASSKKSSLNFGSGAEKQQNLNSQITAQGPNKGSNRKKKNKLGFKGTSRDTITQNKDSH